MDDPLKLFFDRNVGRSIPEALRSLGLSHVYHHHMPPAICGEKPKPEHKGSLFAGDCPDDEFLKFCGQRGWIMVSQDYKWHLEDIHRETIRQHKIGVFYMWGAEINRWDAFRILVAGYPRLMTLAGATARPFIFRGTGNAQWRPVSLDPQKRRKPKASLPSGPSSVS